MREMAPSQALMLPPLVGVFRWCGKRVHGPSESLAPPEKYVGDRKSMLYISSQSAPQLLLYGGPGDSSQRVGQLWTLAWGDCAETD